jgi:PIN domain nuclease of toxin-antitoxin system
MARFLLDTHAFLWWVNDNSELTKKARSTISNGANECYLSVASCWEMAIKSSLGRLKLARPLEYFISEQLEVNNFKLLNIELRHTAKLEKLPFHHRDPFDRLLIAQALTEKMTLVAADAAFSDYGVKLLW